eukprot:CAMPEP_0194757136 /NCGR_PEP_ID=MMETSP0323_2-20130528/10703_1 /TAXON_ID=2866 ORGANISM="Crypthecodinium cohnii, Strain Seligo" /NCGR_SAMPLE_ID=MMETSP0323_2 /ASSEMBLY_ACC=CAM_ASM_000346 /LENGTH=44 /DNA_ID= /DNA_START= /DNA_END= /DNA_ORIENTATION=
MHPALQLTVARRMQEYRLTACRTQARTADHDLWTTVCATAVGEM